jgi:hypothetical protein
VDAEDKSQNLWVHMKDLYLVEGEEEPVATPTRRPLPPPVVEDEPIVESAPLLPLEEEDEDEDEEEEEEEEPVRKVSRRTFLDMEEENEEDDIVNLIRNRNRKP